jgi:aldehyde:ferredoxin oxidoreductase
MTKGASAGHVVTDEELQYLKKIYYEYKGWTEEGLIPKKLLVDLGMEDIAEEIGV